MGIYLSSVPAAEAKFTELVADYRAFRLKAAHASASDAPEYLKVEAKRDYLAASLALCEFIANLADAEPVPPTRKALNANKEL